MNKKILITIDSNSLTFYLDMCYLDLNLKSQGTYSISKIKKFNEKGKENKQANKPQENPQETAYEKPQ